MDQLFIWGTSLAAAQVLSGLLFLTALTLIIVLRTKAIRSEAYKNISMVLELQPKNKAQDVVESSEEKKEAVAPEKEESTEDEKTAE